MSKMRDRLLKGLIVCATWLALSAPAWAHPHVWIKVESTLLYENGAFSGVRHKWTFDEAYTTMAIAGLDKNQDGKFDRSELAELAKVNIEALKDFQYFTFPTLAGQAVKVGEPRDYWLEHKDGLLALHFTLPFASPILADAKGFTFAVYDASYFIAFELAKTEHPIRLSSGAPKGCSIKPDAPQQRDAAALGAMSQLGGVVSIGQSVSIECKGS